MRNGSPPSVVSRSEHGLGDRHPGFKFLNGCISASCMNSCKPQAPASRLSIENAPLSDNVCGRLAVMRKTWSPRALATSQNIHSRALLKALVAHETFQTLQPQSRVARVEHFVNSARQAPRTFSALGGLNFVEASNKTPIIERRTFCRHSLSPPCNTSCARVCLSSRDHFCL
jgi:hypothetical protein